MIQLKMEKVSELFPTTTSLGVFICYMVFCVGQGIFVTASHSKEGSYKYNTVTVVLLTETVKLILAYLCFIKDNSLSSLWQEIRSSVKILCLYLVPSFLYCIYNNLAFINLSHFDPTSYFILLQLRVVITGIMFQVVFKKKLTKIQWFSLGLLTCGCMIQQIDWYQLKDEWLDSSEQRPQGHSFFSVYLLFIFVQTLCSCFAGVYNEYLLKKSGANVNIFIQNIFMYVDSIFWNLIVLVMQGDFRSSFSSKALSPIFQPLVLVIIMNNSLVGITTSFFLKSLNSILKIFASAMELLFTAVLSWLIFGIEIKFNTVLAIFIVSYSLYIYSQNPVNNRNKVPAEEMKRADMVAHIASKSVSSSSKFLEIAKSAFNPLRTNYIRTWVNILMLSRKTWWKFCGTIHNSY